jgi:hypothetical protein
VRDLAYLFAQVNPYRAVNERDEQYKTGAFVSNAASKAEDDQALVFRHNLDRVRQEHDDKDDYRTDET